MKNNLILNLSLLLATTLVLTGCNKPAPSETKESSKVSSTVESTIESSEEARQTSSTGNVDFSEVSAKIKENMDADSFEVLYASQGNEIVKQDGFDVSLDGYELIEAKNFQRDYDIAFDNTERGGIFLAQFTLKNNRDDAVYFTPTFDVSFDGASKTFAYHKFLFPDNVPLISSLVNERKGEIKAKEELTGYYAIPFDETSLDTILSQGKLTLDVLGAFTQPDTIDSEKKISDNQQLTLPVSNDNQAKEVVNSANDEFYQDKITLDNMGDKTMITSKDNINETVTKNDVSVSLSGYQFADFVPNEEYTHMFSSFEHDLVILTLKYRIKNDGDDAVSFSTSYATLKPNNGNDVVMGQLRLLPYRSEKVAKGEEKEFLQVFILDKEKYEKIWKDKTFSTEMKLSQEDGKDIAKGEYFIIELPY